MKLHDRIHLIPRNNWDYSFSELVRAVTVANKYDRQAPNTEKLFLMKPVWTNSGRTSLYAILKSLELPTGAKVGVPLFCCSVVFNAIRQAGYSPCFLDSNIEDFNLSIENLRKKQPELAAVIVVHMFGNPCDMDAILAAAKDIPVIEDCAQSIYSSYKGTQTGLLSTASFFSFRCGKYISAGEGSAILCGDSELLMKIERMVNSFTSWSTLHMFTNTISTFIKATLYNRPWSGLIGYPVGMRLDKKFNLTAKDGFETGKIASTHLSLVEARILEFQEKIDVQREHARMLLDTLEPGAFDLPSENIDCSSNWFQFPIRFQTKDQRDMMFDYLLNQGIDTSKYLDTIADEARINYGYQGDCSNAELLSNTVLLVPIHYNLHIRDIEHIARSINTGSQLI
jgi:dTDP-4-amino-4,6-dideoxygalactose transaminase